MVLPPNFRLKNGPRYNRCKPGGKASGKAGSKGGGKSGDKTGGKAGGKGGWKGGEEGGEEGGALPNLVCLGSEIRGSASSCGQYAIRGGHGEMVGRVARYFDCG